MAETRKDFDHSHSKYSEASTRYTGLLEYQEKRAKKAVFHAFCSIIPGAGQVLAGDPFRGILSFFVVFGCYLAALSCTGIYFVLWIAGSVLLHISTAFNAYRATFRNA